MGFFDLDAPPFEPWRAALFAELAGRHQGVHNFSIGILESYFRLGALAEESILFDQGVLVLSGLAGSSSVKTFVFEAAGEERACEFRPFGPIYSIDRLALPKRSAFREVVYDLARVFDRASYDSKNRNRRLLHPAVRIAEAGLVIRRATSADLPAIEEMHAAWVKAKIADPRTHLISFSKKRYLTCMRIAIANPARYAAWIAVQGGRVVSARAIYLEAPHAFSLAFFSVYWDVYPHAVKDVAFTIMRELLGLGFETLNCGASLNRNLLAFKSHWPCAELTSWAYSRDRSGS